jgi:hypothetical protein
MNRRETLKRLGLFAGGTLVTPSLLAEFHRVAASSQAWTPKFVPARHAALLAELVDVVIPATDTPGARDALVHVFVDLFVRDCHATEQQELFLGGLDGLDAASRKDFGRPFLEATREERLALLVRLERESLDRGEPAERSFVRMLKSMTLLGYFSSKPGATLAAEYVHAPGPFQGCVDLKPGQKVHAL